MGPTLTLSDEFGLGEVGNALSQVKQNPSLGSGGKPTATKQPGFFQNVGHTLAQAPGAIANFVGHAIADPIQHTADTFGALSNSKNFNQQQEAIRSSTTAQIKELHTLYYGGRINKAQFNEGLGKVNKQLVDLNKNSEDFGQQLGTPTAAATNLAGTMALPTALAGGGELALSRAAAPLGEDLAKAGIGDVAKRLLAAPFKNALATQPGVQLPGQVAQDVKTNNYGDLATQAAFLGGGAALTKAPAALKFLANKTFGQKGVLSEVFGPRVEQFLKERPEYAPIAKQMQQFTLNHVGGNHEDAAKFLTDHLIENHVLPVGTDPKTVQLEKVLAHANTYYTERLRLQGAVADARAAGSKVPRNSVLTHDYSSSIGKFRYQLNAAEKRGEFNYSAPLDEKKQAVQNLLDTKFRDIRDDTLKNNLADAVMNANNRKEMRDALTGIKTKNNYNVPGYRPAKGYVVTQGPKKITNVPTVAQSGDLKFSRAPALPGVARALTKAGLSPMDQGESTARGLLQDAFSKRLQGRTDLPDKPVDLLRSVQEVASKHGTADIRGMTAGELKRGLGPEYSVGQARSIIKAVKGAYADLPAQYAGAGGKFVNKVIQKTPGMSQYLRIQNFGRFQANPFFAAKRAIKGGLLVGAHGGNPFIKASEDEMKTLENHGLFSRSNRDLGVEDFEGGANIAKNVGKVGPIDRHLLGSLAHSIAQGQGKSLDELLKGPKGDDIANELRNIVGYPKGGYLASPLAKSLNVLLFPSRFETKVALAAGHWLGKQDPLTRVGVLTSLANLSNWLKTDQGIKWQQQNYATIGLLKYFTPISTVSNIVDAVHSGNAGDLAQVGGLPFGVISTILQHQGITPESPYQSPATGAISPQNIPASDGARLQTMLSDLLGSLFSYPGKQAGFGLSKSDIVQGVPGLKPGKTGYDKVTPAATPQQQNVQRVIGTGTASKVQAAAPDFANAKLKPYNAPAPTLAPYKPSLKSGRKKAKVFARPIPR